MWDQNEREQGDGTEPTGRRAQSAPTAGRCAAESLRHVPISITELVTGVVPTAAVESFSRNSYLSLETLF